MLIILEMDFIAQYVSVATIWVSLEDRCFWKIESVEDF